MLYSRLGLTGNTRPKDDIAVRRRKFRMHSASHKRSRMTVTKEFPQLETARLILRVPTPEDAPVMAAFALDNREHLAPWDPLREEDYFTVESFRKGLTGAMEEMIAGRLLQFAIFQKNEQSGVVIGQCTFSNIVYRVLYAANLGYGLDYRFVGQGLMSEALQAAIQYCFDELNLHRIMAGYLPTNERSSRLLRRLGFVPEGYALDYLQIAGRWQDSVMTALTNHEWKDTS